MLNHIHDILMKHYIIGGGFTCFLCYYSDSIRFEFPYTYFVELTKIVLNIISLSHLILQNLNIYNDQIIIKILIEDISYNCHTIINENHAV